MRTHCLAHIAEEMRLHTFPGAHRRGNVNANSLLGAHRGGNVNANTLIGAHRRGNGLCLAHFIDPRRTFAVNLEVLLPSSNDTKFSTLAFPILIAILQ